MGGADADTGGLLTGFTGDTGKFLRGPPGDAVAASGGGDPGAAGMSTGAAAATLDGLCVLESVG